VGAPPFSYDAQSWLLQLRVFRLRFFQDGDVGVGVFPEGEKVLVGGFGFRSVPRESVSTRKAEVSKCAERKIDATPGWSRNFWNSAPAAGPLCTASWASPRT